ncbi:MAG: hypothetical protein OEZ01_00130 [Candidatus Heimdallarchaeota archaeon]|nr:hypothetical protein [Candidatus Heimdallarchaeota archaeon]
MLNLNLLVAGYTIASSFLGLSEHNKSAKRRKRDVQEVNNRFQQEEDDLNKKTEQSIGSFQNKKYSFSGLGTDRDIVDQERGYTESRISRLNQSKQSKLDSYGEQQRDEDINLAMTPLLTFADTAMKFELFDGKKNGTDGVFNNQNKDYLNVARKKLK